MNTQSHLLLAAAVLGRGQPPKVQAAILIGALLPDLSIFALALYGAAIGMPGAEMWGEAYWRAPWQMASGISNSFPLWAALFAIGLVSGKAWARLLTAAALLHLTFDFPLHAEDAHRHFWPLSDWRFHSPVSYWDPGHYGLFASAAEAGLGLALGVVLWRRHEARAIRALLALTASSYLLVPLFWALMFMA